MVPVTLVNTNSESESSRCSPSRSQRNAGQRDEPSRGAGLGFVDVAELASDLLECADDARLSLEQVQAVSPEACELTPARACVRRCIDQRGEVLTDRIRKPRDLDGVKESLLSARDARQLDPTTWRLTDEARLDGFGEHP
jgi:hypothetical protein